MFDEDVYWDINETKYDDMLRMEYTLPSDATLREDAVHLKYGNEEESAKAKVKLEEIQRRDRKLRADYAKIK
jgi:hypothetical protein